jgi:hypothetical protein
VRKTDNLPLLCADVKKSGGLNLLEPCGSVQACNGTAFNLSFACIVVYGDVPVNSVSVAV